ncbi:putative F-box protein At3g25750 [Mercurialis annua]|uniref:putative F-box protein At3g25750 n=1 Tax=Mercurialis annua TaxID=3986 RepID=UPI002160ACAC|nr:putative F-box protein At3g25750 [Mercurialis annua]
MDILASIFKLLKARIDIIRVGSVCQSWRNSVAYYHSSAKGNVISPLELPFHDSLQKYCFDGMRIPKFLNFYVTITYMVKPTCQDSKSLFIEVDHHHLGQHKARILNLGTRNIKNDINFYRKDVVDSRNYHVSEICRRHTLKHFSGPGAERMTSLFRKVIVYPDNDRTIKEDCVVFAIARGYLVYCKFGEWDWKQMNKYCWEFEDIIVYNGKVYAVDRRSRLWVIGFSSSDYYMNCVCDQLINELRSKTLVESCGDLYLLVTAAVRQETKIYKLKDCKYWDLVQSLNDQIFCIGDAYNSSYNSSFSISTKDYPELNESVYLVRPWTTNDYLCKNFLLNALSDDIYDYYNNDKSARETKEALEEKYI